MDTNLVRTLFASFESIRQLVGGVECWSARELQKLLGYRDWRNFLAVIDKARTACRTAGEADTDHFVEINKMVVLGSGSEREIGSRRSSSNDSPRSIGCALAKNSQKRSGYFSGVLYERGVDNQGFAIIRSKGDQALFGGFSTQQMKRKLAVPGSRPLADFLPTVTIKAKDLAAEMTNVNVIEKDLHGHVPIGTEHVQNNQAVRRALGERGIRPELLAAGEDLEKVKRKLASENKKTLDDMKQLKPKNK